MVKLKRLADLVDEKDDRRRILENIDDIAQAACETETAAFDRELIVRKPDLRVALQAQIAAAELLGQKPLGNPLGGQDLSQVFSPRNAEAAGRLQS